MVHFQLAVQTMVIRWIQKGVKQEEPCMRRQTKHKKFREVQRSPSFKEVYIYVRSVLPGIPEIQAHGTRTSLSSWVSKHEPIVILSVLSQLSSALMVRTHDSRAATSAGTSESRTPRRCPPLQFLHWFMTRYLRDGCRDWVRNALKCL